LKEIKHTYTRERERERETDRQTGVEEREERARNDVRCKLHKIAINAERMRSWVPFGSV
jgi:hypothetical protein